MIDQTTALAIARDYLKSLKWPGIEEMILYDNATIERPFGWVFFYNSKLFIESGDIGDDAVGNAPIIVDRRDGSIHVTGTAGPLERYLDRYEKSRSANVDDSEE